MAKEREPNEVVARDDDEGGIKITLPESICGNTSLMRRLNHRVVDIVADYGFVGWLVADVEHRLEALSADVMYDYTTALIRESRAARKEASRG